MSGFPGSESNSSVCLCVLCVCVCVCVYVCVPPPPSLPFPYRLLVFACRCAHVCACGVLVCVRVYVCVLGWYTRVFALKGPFQGIWKVSDGRNLSLSPDKSRKSLHPFTIDARAEGA